MAVLKGYEPAKVFGYFEDICNIPHGSGNTKQLSDWLVSFAKERSLEYHQDEMGNVIMIKEASPGFEGAEPVILQGHMDMVCNQDEDCDKDMASEALDLAVDGDKLFARGTTLGGDDGIAVAFMLAVLDDEELKHPRVETVFTTEEETGLFGAEALDVSPLTGKRFINLDSEDEGVLTAGCAGGVDVIASLPLTREAYDGKAFAVRVSGLRGGHSGTDIIYWQENAAKVIGRLLLELQEEAGARIVSIDSGVADNVIPVAADAVIVSPSQEKVMSLCDKYRSVFAHEFKADPGFTLTVTETAAEKLPMDEVSGAKAVAYLIGTPNGIQKMTFGIDNLPQTSLSLGLVSTDDDSIEYTFCLRSSVDSECDMIARRLECQMKVLGGSVRFEGQYPGWEYATDSKLRQLVCEVYHQQTGKEMVVETMHAGLECGYFAGKIPGLDCVSIGPDLRDVHTPNETMSISSVQRTWELLKAVLERLK